MADTLAMPKLGFDMAEGTLVRWVKAEGAPVNKGDVVAEIETDKATVEVESTFSGTLLRRLVDEGAIVPVGTPIAIIGAAGEKVDAPEAPKAKAAAKAETPVETDATPLQPELPVAVAEGGRVKASPLARKMAAVSGVSLAQVRGSGPGGRIVRKDVEAMLAAAPAPAPAKLPSVSATRAPVVAQGDEVVAMDRLRAAIGRRLVESKQQIPHFYVTHEYDVEELLDLRAKANATLPEGSKLSVNDFLVKAVALTLREFPAINASLKGDQILRHGQVNIGVAVSVPGGLMTVVVKDADRKPLAQISAEVREMAARARAGKVRPEDIEGSTFSISNLGMFEVDEFAAIINPPEAAILAVGSARNVPVVKDGAVVPGWRMKMTISADHRVTDGAEAAQFMQALAKVVENPLALLVR